MRVVDSSVWIEWLSNTNLVPRLKGEIPVQSNCIVPTIVQLEVFKWLARQQGMQAAEGFMAYTRLCEVVDLDTNIARFAAEISAELKLSTADAVIYATARHRDADLLTCDRHFETLKGVAYIEK